MMNFAERVQDGAQEPALQLSPKLGSSKRSSPTRRVTPLRAGLASVLAVALMSTTAAASDRPGHSGRAMFQSGLWTFGGSYIPAVVVATVSPRDFDKPLYIPLAGPWIDLATRDCPDCRHETVNKVLLVGSGVFQAVGAINILGSLFFGGRHDYAADSSPTRPAVAFSVAPVQFNRNAYGAMATGSF